MTTGLETAWRDVSRGALEAVALEGYRDGALSRDQVGRLLRLSLWDTEAFLKERQAHLAYTKKILKRTVAFSIASRRNDRRVRFILHEP